MRVRYRFIDNVLHELRTNFSYLNKPAIKVERLISDLEIDLTEKDYGDSLSGVAIVNGPTRIISVNRGHSRHRRRFTLAHELGHILLHADQPISVDVNPVAFLRDEASSTGESWREVEANYFAANLLMPKKIVQKEVAELWHKFPDEDDLVQELAKYFDVSPQSMGIRMGSIGSANV